MSAIRRTLYRLLTFPFTPEGTLGALITGLSKELHRVHNLAVKVRLSAVPNVNTPIEALSDLESRYGIRPAAGSSDETRIARVIKRAGENGNGSPSWLEDQIRGEGFDLYVIINEPDSESTFPQFGDFQFADVQFGGLVSYVDPRNVDGEIIASSPSSYLSDRITPADFVLPSDPNRWPYVFFLSPFPNRLAGPTELLSISSAEWVYLRRMIMQTKWTRNWALAQIEVIS